MRCISSAQDSFESRAAPEPFRRDLVAHLNVITLRVPEKADLRKVAQRVAGEIIRRRAHQVRGHWRDDWRLPKGNKSLWVTEHQRGDASIGFVTHDYLVEHPSND